MLCGWPSQGERVTHAPSKGRAVWPSQGERVMQLGDRALYVRMGGATPPQPRQFSTVLDTGAFILRKVSGDDMICTNNAVRANMNSRSIKQER